MAATVDTLAGSTSGFADGAGAAAKFYYLFGVAADAAGNIYVGDSNNQRIRKISPDGTVGTLAGSGSPGCADGVGAAASFDYPYGVTVDSAGNLYVADHSAHRLRKITPDGTVSTLAGSTSGFADGAGAAASFDSPTGVTVDAAGNVFVADTNNERIRKITPNGTVSTLAGSGHPGSIDGVGATASFNSPLGVAVDAAGNLLVADCDNHRIRRLAAVAAPLLPPAPPAAASTYATECVCAGLKTRAMPPSR